MSADALCRQTADFFNAYALTCYKKHVLFNTLCRSCYPIQPNRALHGEMDRISQALAQRVKELAERYETPLPKLAERVEELEARVNRHLERMGFAWK
jgi:hypothetical protein